MHVCMWRSHNIRGHERDQSEQGSDQFRGVPRGSRSHIDARGGGGGTDDVSSPLYPSLAPEGAPFVGSVHAVEEVVELSLIHI